MAERSVLDLRRELLPAEARRAGREKREFRLRFEESQGVAVLEMVEIRGVEPLRVEEEGGEPRRSVRPRLPVGSAEVL